MNKIFDYRICPDDNELALFVEGKLSGERLVNIRKHLNQCRLCNESVHLALELQSLQADLEETEIVKRHAAKTNDNLCAIKAEEYLLSILNIEVNAGLLIEIARDKGWLTKMGVQFKNIGRLLEYYNCKVERKSKCNILDIKMALDKGCHVMVGVDKGELLAKTRIRRMKEKLEDWIDQRPDHVMIVKEILPAQEGDGSVVLINPENKKTKLHTASLKRFLNSWEDSDNYMVIVCKD